MYGARVKRPDRRRSRQLAASARRDVVFMTGQSLADGIEGDDDPGQISTTQPYSNQQFNVSGVLSSLVNTDREKPHVPACNTATFLSAGAAWQLACRNVSSTGAPYSELKKNGTGTVYQQIINSITALQAGLAGQGGIRVVAFFVVHGENDEAAQPGGEGTTAAQYEAFLKEWRSDFDADTSAITGQTEQVLLITDQQSSWMLGSTGTNTPDVAQAQSRAGVRRDSLNKVFCAGPKYHLPYSASSKHLTGAGYRGAGQKYGQVLHKLCKEGQIWRPLEPGGITVAGNDITIAMRVPDPPIVFDTTAVALKANYGFEYSDDLGGGAPTISTVEIVPELGGDDYRVRVTLSGPPRAGSRIRYAFTAAAPSWPGNGLIAQNAGSARGNLRDSDATSSLYSLPMYNWCVHFDEPTGV